MAISETSVRDAELLAIEEINAAGGVLGKQIEAVAGFPECMKSHNNIPIKLDSSLV